jgi:hypothetical protein
MRKILVFFLCIVLLCAMKAPFCLSQEEVLVVSCEGEVKVVHHGTIKSVSCKTGMSLEAGARIITGAGAFVRIAFDKRERNIIKIKGKSDVVLKLSDGDKIELIEGEVYALLRDLKPGETFRVRTPSAVCGARGTGWRTHAKGNTSEVATFDGKVFVRGINKDGSVMDGVSWVRKGYKRSIEQNNKPGKDEKLSAGEVAAMEKEVGLDQVKKNKKKKKIRLFGTSSSKREDYKESLLERKSESARNDKDKTDDRRGGGRETIGP